MAALHTAIAITVPFVLQLALLYWVSRRLGRTQVAIHRYWHHFQACVGTAVHETSHAIGCILTGTRITEYKPFSPQDDGTLGWVSHEKAGRLATTVIAIAPLFGNGAVLYLLGRFAFSRVAAPFVEVPELAITEPVGFGQLVDDFALYVKSYGGYLGTGFGGLDLTDWQTYVFVYLAMSIGSHAAPSREDLKHFFAAVVPLFLIVAVAGALLAAYGPESWGATAGQGVAKVVSVLTAAVAISVVFSLVSLALNLVIYAPIFAAKATKGSR